MPTSDVRSDPPTRPYLREGLLLLAFLALLAVSAFTVVMPELSRAPDSATTARPPATQHAGQAGAPSP